MNTHITKVRQSLVLEGILSIFSNKYGDDWFGLESRNKKRRIYYFILDTILYIDERDHLDDYLKALSEIPENKLNEMLLANDYETQEVEEMDYTAFLNKVKALLEEVLVNDPSVVERFDTHQDEISQMKNQMLVELENRHPLSYGQGLMGKSFYNIFDWSEYEFIPVCSGPFKSLRVMTDRKNILIYNVKKSKEKLEETKERLSQGMKLLADPNRLEIMRMIKHSPMCGKDIASAMNLTTATVSHHMDLLRKAGLLHVERDQNTKYFSVNYHKVMGLSRDIQSYILNRK
ncbi:winged helix-turn-helix transcriptional regulator [Acidaminobacter sp. JC074]|uniref:ArsR/SmtB family transcription factor n=1 Tax=Acidaminobacter sp. JC074 TaxID=2530199 RepID=UPI001F0EFB9D|nr:metalloregulator ArsR/SmtB family transcription factor [Acidaminobacter sp. JC074]MCH4886261.1 winged helix-turn-helix transcriptional regulator [Acidaminobacter sp. JC074]